MSNTERDEPDVDTMDDQAPAVPDYLASPDAVLSDEGVEWRYGQPPDYSKTREYWRQTKKLNHTTGSLPEQIENLVKNWEIEASFKPQLQDWRTIDHQTYTFTMNGGQPQPGEHMLRVGTYNAIIAAPNQYYSPEHMSFSESHKIFTGMMPTFAWEVMEVYSGPPTVSFKWRHWGLMKNDYVGVNDKGVKVRAKAHSGLIQIFGVGVAKVDSSVRLQSVDIWMDPMEIFRQIAPDGMVEEGIHNAPKGWSDCERSEHESEHQSRKRSHPQSPDSEHTATTSVGRCRFAKASKMNLDDSGSNEVQEHAEQ